MAEAKGCIQLPAARKRHAHLCFGAEPTALANRITVVSGKHTLVHFPQIFVQMRPIHVLFNSGDGAFLPVRQTVKLRNQVNNIQPEPIDALVHPPIEHIIDFFAQRRVFPVEVHLLAAKQVQRPFADLRVVIPCRLRKEGLPVVRRDAFSLSLTPDIIILVFGTRIPERRLEPRVFIRCMVEHHIHDQAHAARMDFRKQMVKVLHGAVIRMDLSIIPDIVTVVIVRGIINRAKPHDVHAECLKVVEL